MMMKKVVLVLLILFLIPTTVLAWDDCPLGEVFCEGKCGLFVDTDGDGICDRSQLALGDRDDGIPSQSTEEEIEEIHDLISGQDLRTKTVNEVAEIYQIDVTEFAEKLSEYLGINVKPENSFEFLHSSYGLTPSAAKDISTSIRLGTQIDISEPNSKQNLSETTNQRSARKYNLLPTSIFLVVLYIISHILSKKEIISIVNHRKIWNVLLLITFLISGILGILLVIRINFGTVVFLPFNILFWHVEAGIAMFAISVFHTSWHWKYFKNLFGVRKTENSKST